MFRVSLTRRGLGKDPPDGSISMKAYSQVPGMGRHLGHRLAFIGSLSPTRFSGVLVMWTPKRDKNQKSKHYI